MSLLDNEFCDTARYRNALLWLQTALNTYTQHSVNQWDENYKTMAQENI